MHGASKRRTWRKLHVGANPEDGEIQAVLLTENSVSDAEAVEGLLEQIASPFLILRPMVPTINARSTIVSMRTHRK